MTLGSSAAGITPSIPFKMIHDDSTSSRDDTNQFRTATSAQAPVVVIGAGPAGLTAALQLAELGVPVVVVEANQRVGGLAQTVEYKGFRFDIGGHRFYTKVAAVSELWRSMLGADFLKRPRLSRIFFDGKFFDYPLKPVDALAKLGILRSIAILWSCLWIKIRPIHPEVSFEDWVTNRFGRRLFRTFFETYTEKVWGIPCRSISARWAAQRIQGLSLKTAVIHMLAPWLNRRPGRQVTTLVDEFEYPRLGPGMMWEAFAARIEQLGGSVLLNARVTAILHDGHAAHGVEIEHADGRRSQQVASKIVSTMALTHLVKSLGQTPPPGVQQATLGLKYRDFITVAVVVDRSEVFPDNWIYIHDPSVKMGRIQNFKNWSADMVPDQTKTCLGLEYFCTAGDGVSSLSNDQLVELAKTELGAIGLVDPRSIIDATVVRMPKAYPVYDERYEQSLTAIRAYVSGFANLQTIGRNGTHTYNNQDHSMVMGMLAVRNLLGEEHDVWTIDHPDEYLEELQEATHSSSRLNGGTLASTQPLLPTLVRAREAFEPR
jgi:protoporphyrinogen oxidase